MKSWFSGKLRYLKGTHFSLNHDYGRKGRKGNLPPSHQRPKLEGNSVWRLWGKWDIWRTVFELIMWEIAVKSKNQFDGFILHCQPLMIMEQDVTLESSWDPDIQVQTLPLEGARTLLGIYHLGSRWVQLPLVLVYDGHLLFAGELESG